MLTATDNSEITLAILAGTGGMLILVFAIILFVVVYQKRLLAQEQKMKDNELEHQRRLIEATLEVQEKERKIIASDIHDDLGAMLSAAKMNISRIAMLHKQHGIDSDISSQTNHLVQESINKMRSISRNLISPVLERFGLYIAIKDLSDQINNSGFIEVKTTCNVENLELNDHLKTQLYRLAQELTNNILKHAEASELSIDICYDNREVSITFTHNGMGISQEEFHKLAESKKGVGLRSIMSRINSIDGKITYFSESKEKPAQIVINVPNGEN